MERRAVVEIFSLKKQYKYTTVQNKNITPHYTAYRTLGFLLALC